MLRLAQFQAADTSDRMCLLSCMGTCVLEHHTPRISVLYYAVGDFFVEVRYEGPERHPCLSMTAFAADDELCERMISHLDESLAIEQNQRAHRP